jgi:hypothetical protein
MLQKLTFALNPASDNSHLTAHQEQDCFYLMSRPEHPLWAGMSMMSPECVLCVTELEPGVYGAGLNFDHNIAAYTQFDALRTYDRLDKNGIPARYESGDSMSDYFESTVATYGVADSVEQVKSKYKALIESTAQIVIAVTEMRRDEQSESGGWRWHKWGEYIGTQEITREYLFDEPAIESVFVFHVYSVVPKLDPAHEDTAT